MITIDRLKLRIEEMAGIGKSESGGNTRLALSAEDKQARKLLISWMEKLNLTIKIDDFGNIYGKKEGTSTDLAPVMLGSHIDTVPDGGKFDGVLGVLGALEALETYVEELGQPRRSIELVSFTNEEGARFTPQMLGSGAVTGKFTPEYTYNRVDTKGLGFEEELRNIGFLGDAKNRLQDVHSFIELHIEQGPVLDRNHISIAAVEGIAGFSWMEIILKGESNHSGTTPMQDRSDSLVAATALIQKLNQWVNRKDDGTVLTVGKIYASPGSMNVIPEKTTFTVDVRVHEEKDFDRYLTEIKRIINQISKEYSKGYDLNEIRTQAPIAFATHLTDLIENISKKQQLSCKRMKSGAGHDSMYIQNVADTAMIFVPSVNGISHSPEEHTEWKDIENGVNVLYETMKKLVE